MEEAPGEFRAEVTPHDIEVVLRDDVALALFYLDGTFTWPGGVTLEGPWRVTEVWIREDGEWKELHHHDSPLRAGAGEQESAAEAIDSIRRAEMVAFSEADVERLLGLFSEDAVVMPPGEPLVTGRAEERAWLEDLYEGFEVDARYTDSDLTLLDGVAYETLAFTMTLTPKDEGKPTSVEGKGLHIYQRQPDGSWKIVLDIWNANQPAASPEGSAAAIERTTRDWAAAYVAGDAARAASFVTEDGVFVPPNAPRISGRDAIRRYNEQLLEDVSIEEVTTIVDGARFAGDWAVSHGSWALVFSENGESFADTTRYVVIWERQPDGSWLAARDIWNSALPAAAEP